MRLITRRYLVPIRPFLIRNFPVFIGVILSGLFGSSAVVVLVENYYFPLLSNAAAEITGLVLVVFITHCNFMIVCGRPKWTWGMYALFIACLLVAVPGYHFSPNFLYAECFFWPILGLLLLRSKRHREMRAAYVELRHMRAKVVAAVKKRRKHECAIIRIKKPR
ncbi:MULTISPECIES: hypothetical protein [unclassified Pseudomonas]|uniref:hypothetical protein n=1 Tax=unclassified Pseudomonas TaxID=196821 RepID=UPI000CDA825C|nr:MULTISPECIES: hypothetical protein [unclassified Pseudomonas]MCK3826580.1 hypothetical protein [Pseudomonas sp. W2Aug9]MCK3851855.1 hypothetical protein [Pseudomonas sp. W2Jun17]